jgi:RNA polymerase sigma-70 factor (ECF subfamily)
MTALMTLNNVRILIEAAKAGDQRAFEALVDKCRGRLETLIRLRLGPELRGAVEAEDVLQETMTRAFQSLAKATLRDDKALLGWLGGIAEHVILDLARRHARRRAAPLDGEVAGSQVSPSKGLRRHERFERLAKALDGLSPDHREVILLARIEGLPLQEVARRMDRSMPAVAKLLSRALKKLREAFGDTESLPLPDRCLGDRGGPGAPGSDREIKGTPDGPR